MNDAWIAMLRGSSAKRARLEARWTGVHALFTTLAFLLFLAAPALAAPTFPPLTGRVVDQANIIPDAVEVSLTDKLAQLEAKTTDQFVVVTLSSLQGYEIADFGYQLGRFWGIGQKDKNNGVLLIVAPNERDVRIEVGYGLEGDLTDAVTKLIIDNAILPKFRAGDYPGGIAAGVDDVIKVLTGDAATFKQQAAEEQKTFNGKRDEGGSSWSWIITIIVIFFILSRFGGWFWPLLFLGGRGGGWSGGGSWGSSGGGWSGGGGFSGGGGSFGGGGSSGRW
ncbi:MAG TPA: TPM domain-containing protein [Bauldia sp.]|nr:TPM domain-containing protein [Bauldia sp.]